MNTALEELPDEPGALGGLRGGSGPRIVFVHGFTQSAASWGRVLAHLDGAYEVLALDLPGHRSSASIGAADLGETASLLAKRGGRASYVGYSLGGRCCLTLALEHPEVVESLVLVGATPGIADSDERAARVRADEALAARLDPTDGHPGLALEDFLSEWLAGPLFAHLSAEQADLASRLANTPAGLADSLRRQGTGTQTPSHDRLGELDMPVLLVAGARDERFSKIAEDMAGAIGANARVTLLEDAGHATPFEEPKRFAALLEDFFARL
jgi:2-succinyl-6-hydroxy-2,4-cyclohexadiene-1-carboxylate synthase